MIRIENQEIRPKANSMFRGFLKRCPNCAKGTLYYKYLKVVDSCSSCSEDLSHHRADDAPPYFTIFIVGHIIIPLALATEKMWQLETSTHLLIWMPLIVILSLVLLPAVKGAVVGLQWALRMHGFGEEHEFVQPGRDKIHGVQ